MLPGTKTGLNKALVGPGLFLILVSMMVWPAAALSLTVNVVDHGGNSVSGFRWLLEEDNTNLTIPGTVVSNSISLDIHKSHAPVVSKGRTASSSAVIPIPDPNKRYFVSILPDSGHTMSGAAIAKNQTSARVVVHGYPIPTAQISVLVFEDHHPINNVFDPTETGLAGWQVVVFDQAGQIVQDALGNPIQGFDVTGTTPTGPPGTILTGADGRVFIKNLAPGKYGVRAIPPGGQSTAWVQTATIEGTPGIDAWVKPNEPPYFLEGFGTAFTHVFIGFVNPTTLPWANGTGPGGTSITGRNIFTHFPRPSTGAVQFFPGPPVSECWVGLNDPLTQQGLAAAPCNPLSEFTISGVPDGTYQLVTWDKPLDALFGLHTVAITGGAGGNLGDVLSFRWFGTLKGKIFYDTNQNGYQDAGENTGLVNQAVNLRFRDGSIYQATVTDPSGEYAFSEVFPFFKWLVAEVDFARYKATGMTTAVDYGGQIPPANGWIMPSFDELNPQPQASINPNTGNNLSRTETGPVLTQAMMLFLNQTNVIDWGKVDYVSGPVSGDTAFKKSQVRRGKTVVNSPNPGLQAYVEENGGISGIVYYATVRAEDDPRNAGAEPWEPGIPRVQVNLYQDFNDDNIPDGPAIATAFTDSWDDNLPADCIQDPLTIHGQQVKKCYDNYSTWNQVRPGLFDGGYAFGPDLPKGAYIVEVILPSGYELFKEEDKNVDFGDEYTPSLQANLGALPPPCVGPLHTVPAELTLFPGVPAPFAGTQRPLCNRKRIVVEPGKNAAVDFHLFTEVPKAARTVGFVNNDLAAEFNSPSPIFGEKASPSWLPISFQDWAGNEITRAYTDEWGSYNALLPSTFTANVPYPSGMAPNMVNVCLNFPLMDDPANPGQKKLDPFYNPDFSQSCWTFDFWPGKTTYLDTPIVPLAAFVGPPNWGLDVEPLNGTPVIHSVSGPSGGPYVGAAGQRITLYSPGQVMVPNPGHNPATPGSTPFITRNYGFGTTPGTVTLGGLALTNVIWTDYSITGHVPAGLANPGSHQLVVTNSAGVSNEIGVTVHIGGGFTSVYPGGPVTIQQAVDNAVAGELILVAPGTYSELVIMHKPVRLQGWGAGSTVINASPFPTDKLAAWRTKLQGLYSLAGVPFDPNRFMAKEGPGVMVIGDLATPSAFLTNNSRIDGFTITGSLAGGGIYLDTQANNLQLTNNKIKGNQGTYGGGITLGTQNLTGSANTGVVIRNNHIVKNSGRAAGGGGVSIFDGSTNYQVTNNFISGNFSTWNGAGLAHYGLSDNGLIQGNKFLYNEVFFGGAVGGEAGGIYLSGIPGLAGALTEGAGNVTVNGNLIQGNLAGAGKGGGIRATTFSGLDVQNNPGEVPNPWHNLRVYNNIIVNNVAAYGGGGIALQDVAKSEIINNTIANNYSTSTAAAAFPGGQLTTSAPEGAGIVSGAHTAGLAALTVTEYSNPLLVNNIIGQNTSYFWDGTQTGTERLVPYAGPDGGNWDLQVFGTTAPQLLNPQNCLLSSLAAGYGGSNVTGAPNFLGATTNTLRSAIVIDEGGNSISVRYTPLTRTSNYHIGAGSAALNGGTSLEPPAYAVSILTGRPGLAQDYDGQTRPLPPAAWDIGADEVL